MPLPILKTSSRLSTAALIRQFHQSEMYLSDNLAEAVQADTYRIYCDPSLVDSPQANRVVDVVGIDAGKTIDDAERVFRKGVRDVDSGC